MRILELLSQSHFLRVLRRKLPITAVVIVCVAFAVVFVFPYAYIAISSFKPRLEVISSNPTFWPKTWLTLENFKELFSRIPVGRYIFNSFVIAAANVVLCVSLGTLASYAISRSMYRASTFFFLIVLCLKMIPIPSIVVPIYEIVTWLGIHDTHIALIFVSGTINLPFVIWVMLGFYEGISRSLDEAAIVDGAGPFVTYFRVILPLSLPGVATVSIFTFFSSWNNFLLPLLLTSTRVKTFPVAIADFMGQYTQDYGALYAASFIFSFPALILCIILQKYIVNGFTAGAVKG